LIVSNIGNNLEQLMKLYKIVTPQGLLGSYKLESFTDSPRDINTDFLGQIINLFVNTSDSSGSGLLLYDEIKEKLGGLPKKASGENGSDMIKDYVDMHDDVSMDRVFGSQNPEKSDAKLRVISLKSPHLGLSLRDVNRIGTFLNAVSSVELSRCQPLLDVKFELEFRGEANNTSDPKFAAGLSARSTSLLRYLNGSAQYGSADQLMAQGSLTSVDLSSRSNTKKYKDAWKNSSTMTSGMELFTSPQTLTSPDSTLSARPVPILDRFAGLMSIESFEITATPAGGSYMHKTGKLSLVVHDRSRLHEVAELIKPDAYSRTTLSISYGWSHPDTSSNSPIGDLINQMIVRDEKYNIVNSSFSFGGSNSVKITLSLAMKGSSELNVIRIAESKEFLDIEQRLVELSESIRDYRNTVPGLSAPDYSNKEVKVYQLIDSAANNGELIDNYASKQALAELDALFNKLKQSKKNSGNGVAIDELGKAINGIKEFVTLKDKANSNTKVDSKVDASNSDIRPLITHVLGDKFKTMVGQLPGDKGVSSAPDPYIFREAKYWSNQKFDLDELDKIRNGSSTKPRQFVSLAKILLFYVGLPLQKVGAFSEIQFVYYPFNTEAGDAAGTCLSSFPVDIHYLLDVMADHAKRKGNANLTVREFISVLVSATLQDVRSWAYGLRDNFVPRKNGDITSEATKKPGVDKLDGRFRKPVVEIQIETRAGRVTRAGETPESKDARIVRIHVYDKLASAYEPVLKLLEAQKGLESYDPTEGSLSLRMTLNNIAQLVGLSELKDGKMTDRESLRRLVTASTPVLTYGSNNSGIIAASLQTMQNSDLATVNMQRAMGPQSNSEPNGSSVSAIPMRVQPAQLDLTLIGCPLLAGTQQYFIDFGTGTTLDDLYTLTHLSHRIAAGKFESTAKLIPMNAYGTYDNLALKLRKLSKEIDSMLKDRPNTIKTWGE
jgi:hypothetical protein